MNAQRYYLTLIEAAAVVYPKGWRTPLTDVIAAQIEREERRRDADEHPGASNTDNEG